MPKLITSIAHTISTSTLAHGTNPTPWRNKMKLYNITWTQKYSTWPVEDLAAAREVLARIMAK